MRTGTDAFDQPESGDARRRLGLTGRTRRLIDEQSRRFSPSRPRFSGRRAVLPEFPH